jgi:hypothetical protein
MHRRRAARVRGHGDPRRHCRLGIPPAHQHQRPGISAAHALALTFAAIAVYAVPTIAIASFGLLLSVITRQSVAGVVGTIFYTLTLQGLAALPAIKGARPYILVTQLHAWHGPFETPTNWALIWHGIWISVLYATPPLTAAWIIFRRRDVTS